MPTPNNPFEQIIIPQEIPSAWPPAPIYWVLLVAVIALLSLTVFLIKQQIKKKKIVKLAHFYLSNLQKEKASFVKLNQLFKAICLQYYPRAQVASLTGKEWFIFIQQHNTQQETVLFKDQDTFCQRLYQQDSLCTEDDFEAAKQWITMFPAQVKTLRKSIQVGKDNV